MADGNSFDVIKAAIGSAREEGIIGPADDDETPVIADEDVADEDGEGEGADDNDEPEEGDEVEGDGEEGEGEGETPETDEEEGKSKPPAKTKEKEGSLDDPELVGPDGKPLNRVPHNRIPKIVANQVAKRMDPVLKALGIDVTKVGVQDLHTHIHTAVADVVDERDVLRVRVKAMDDVAPLMETNAKGMIEMLAATFPDAGYESFLAGKGGAKPADKSDIELPSEEDDPEPQPDQEIEIGGKKGMTYSREKFKEHAAWSRRQGVRDADKVWSKKFSALEARLAPVERHHKSAQTAAEKDAALTKRVGEIMQDARTWKGFTDNEEAIRAKVKEYPKLSLEKAVRKAYEEVVVEGIFLANYEANRKRWNKEAKKAPKSTTVVRGSSAPRSDEVGERGDDQLPGSQAAIKEALRKARANGTLPPRA